MKFFKDSIRELKHVVWPTKEDTRKYFLAVLSILVLFGIYLFVFSTLFSEILYSIRNFVSPSNNVEKNIDKNITISTWKISTWTTNESLTWTTQNISTWTTSTGSTN